MLKRLRGRLRRPVEVEPLTLEEAIAAGIVQLPVRPKLSKKGFWLRHHDFAWNEFGQLRLTGTTEVWWPYGWRDWRNEMSRIYYGLPSRVEFRDVPTGIREPVLNVGPGSSDIEQRVAKSLMIDSGQAKPAYNTDQELRNEYR